MNAHQRVTSAKKDFNNQLDRMSHFVTISQPFSPVTLITVKLVHEQSGCGGGNGITLTKANLSMAMIQCPIF
jgi:hypothetical protein